MKLSANRGKRRSAAKWANTGRLKDPVITEAFDPQLEQVLEGQQVLTWEFIQHSCRRSAEAAIGFTDSDNKPWIRDETWCTIDECKEVKADLDTLRPTFFTMDCS